MPEWSSPRPNSRAEQIMPFELRPYVFRAPIRKFPGSTPPGRITTTRSPAAKLCAPQTMPWGSPETLASPTSTVHQWMVLPFFCGSGSMVSTRPTTSGPLIAAPGRSRDSSLSPRAVSVRASSTLDRSGGRSAYSRIQETGARMRVILAVGCGAAGRRLGARSPVGAERRGESHVALEEGAQVARTAAEHERPVDAHAEGETPVALGVDPTSGEHPRVDHAAAAPFDPALAATGTAVLDGPRLTPADEADHVDLGRGLGEREVRRSEPCRDPLAEHLLGEVVEGALEVGHRDALVDDEPLDLVEHRRVRRVVRVGAEDATRADHVDRRRPAEHGARLHR